MKEIVSLLLCLVTSINAQQFVFLPNNFAVKLTSERGGPPPGAQFVPITVVSIPESGNRPALRPLKGRPPPPPPILVPKPTRRPKPPTLGPVAPPPPPVPVPVGQEIPTGPETSQNLPPLPQGVTVVTEGPEINPALETVSSTPQPPPTTTPNTNDASPAYYQRFTLNDDGSYYFDFESPNTIKRSEQGFVKHDPFLRSPIFVKTGTYSFTSPEGIPFRTDFIADERGYQAFQHTQGLL